MYPVAGDTRYRDKKFFLYLIPFINVVNYYLTYNITFSWKLPVSFAIDTLEGYAAWLVVSRIIIRLDTKIPYDKNPLKRIVIQIMLTIFCGVGAIIILTELVNWIATDHAVPTSFYTKDLLIISIWFFVVNGI